MTRPNVGENSCQSRLKQYLMTYTKARDRSSPDPNPASQPSDMPKLELDNLPSDVITDILCQLPVKTLLRFRCASKRWRSEIDSPDFIKLHLSHSLATKSNVSLILQRWSDLYSVEFDSVRAATELINPPLNDEICTGVSLSCNGLVAVWKNYRQDQEMALWNPSTRKHQILPVMPVEAPKGSTLTTFYGFGHDPISDDYKVVRMVQFDGDHHGSVQVRVYSLKTNSWRGMKDDAIPYFVHNLFPYGRGCGALASGALHWVAPGESGGCCVIVAFDLGVEEFRIVPQPDGVDGGSKVDVVDLVVLEGRLCMLRNYNSGCVDVWVMKEYGLKESWTKAFEVSRDCFDVCSQSSFNRNFGQVKPLAYSKSGDKILLEVDMDKLLWYDFRRKRAERVRIEGAPIPFSADVYVESLVPLGGGGGMDRKTQQPPEEKKKSKRKKIMDDFLSKYFNKPTL